MDYKHTAAGLGFSARNLIQVTSVTSGGDPLAGIPVEITSAEEAREALRRLGVDL